MSHTELPSFDMIVHTRKMKIDTLKICLPVFVALLSKSFISVDDRCREGCPETKRKC